MRISLSKSLKLKLFLVHSGGCSTPWLRSGKVSVRMPQCLPYVFVVYSHTDCFRLTKSLVYLVAELFIYLNVSRAIVLPRCS